MKVRFIAGVLGFCLCALTAQTSRAQSPDQQLGFGVSFNHFLTGFGSDFASGAHVAYALSPSFHLGGLVGLNMASQSSGGENSTSTSTNGIIIAPYGKFLLKGSKNFVPFIMGQFFLLSGDLYKNGNDTPAYLGFSFGGEYFATRNVGVCGSIGVVNLGFSPSRTNFGLLGGQIGIEWFMD